MSAPVGITGILSLQLVYHNGVEDLVHGPPYVHVQLDRRTSHTADVLRLPVIPGRAQPRERTARGATGLVELEAVWILVRPTWPCVLVQDNHLVALAPV